MKKSVSILILFALMFGLSACHTTSLKSSLDLPAGKWHATKETSENDEPQIQIPEYYNGYNYEQTLTLALKSTNDPYYELVWGTPKGKSPDGAFAVYISNKDGLAVKGYSMMLLELASMKEVVLFKTDSDSLYPLWWIDNTRFVYEQDGAYYICDVYKSNATIALALNGENTSILAYDHATFMYIEDADDIENSKRLFLNISEDNQATIVAEFDPAGEKLMMESAVNETLKLAVLKVRTDAEYDRSLLLYNYQSGQSSELKPPAFKDAIKANAIDFQWEGTDLIVNYQVDYKFESKAERWIYSMQESIV